MFPFNDKITWCKDSLPYEFKGIVSLYCILVSLESWFTFSSTIVLSAPRLTKTGLKQMLESTIVRIACNDKMLSLLAETLLGNSSFRDLSISDIASGLLLNNIVWHHKHESGVDLKKVKNLRTQEYLKYLGLHPDDVNSKEEMTAFTDKDVLCLMQHYATYANAIYGVSLSISLSLLM